jgi:hypothetical protein
LSLALEKNSGIAGLNAIIKCLTSGFCANDT